MARKWALKYPIFLPILNARLTPQLFQDWRVSENVPAGIKSLLLSGEDCFMKRRTFQDSLNSFVTQTSPWQIEFREPLTARLVFLIFGLIFGAMSVSLCIVGPSVEPPPGGIISVVLGVMGGIGSAAMIYLSLRHEMHLNFHYRTYNEIVGIGKLRRSRTGSFDEIDCVYTRRNASPKYGGIVFYNLGLSFDSTAGGSVNMAYKRPAYDMMGSSDGESLASYAQDLAEKMGRPYQSFN